MNFHPAHVDNMDMKKGPTVSQMRSNPSPCVLSPSLTTSRYDLAMSLISMHANSYSSLNVLTPSLVIN